MADTDLLAYSACRPDWAMALNFGVHVDLYLPSAPALRQLLVCSHAATVRSGHIDKSQPGDCPTVSFRALRAAFLVDYNECGKELRNF